MREKREKEDREKGKRGERKGERRVILMRTL